MKPYKPKEGEWLPIAWNVRSTCCDCDLVHRLEYRVTAAGLEQRGWRDDRATRQRRRRHKVRILKGP